MQIIWCGADNELTPHGTQCSLSAQERVDQQNNLISSAVLQQDYFENSLVGRHKMGGIMSNPITLVIAIVLRIVNIEFLVAYLSSLLNKEEFCHG